MIKAFFQILLFLSFPVLHAQVVIDNAATDEGQDAFLVLTPYYSLCLQKKAGGISSLCGPDGKDWIGFRKGPDIYPSSAASSYRGIPNLVFGGDDSGTGHPGFENCRSRQTGDSCVVVTSLSGKWQMNYDFYTTYFVINVTKQDSLRPYWFLYEGIPGGSFDPEHTIWGIESIHYSSVIPDYFKNKAMITNTRYAWFGNRRHPYVLFLGVPGKDNLSELLGFLGDTGSPETSSDGMVVWGFGRAEGARPLLTGSRKLIVGFREANMEVPEEQQQLKTYINSLLEEYE